MTDESLEQLLRELLVLDEPAREERLHAAFGDDQDQLEQARQRLRALEEVTLPAVTLDGATVVRIDVARLQSLFAQAVLLEPPARGELLARIEAEDPLLRQALGKMLLTDHVLQDRTRHPVAHGRSAASWHSFIRREIRALERRGVGVVRLAMRPFDGTLVDPGDREEAAQTDQGKKEADRTRRVTVAAFEAEAVDGENNSKASIAERNATLAEAEAEARRRGEVAQAEAARAVYQKEQELEKARLEKEIIVQEEIDKRRVEIEAEAVAERRRREAKGEADAILMKYQAEAEGLRKVLEAKADGYNKLVAACAERPDIAPTLLLIEKMPELVAEQVKAIQNLKIDKVTVWDGGNGGSNGGKGGTAGFLSSLIGALPPMHELAEQAGVELPGFLGKLKESEKAGLGDKPAQV